MSGPCHAFAHLLFLIAMAAQAETIVKAKLIAYRPAEIVRQVASHVLNKEVFLFSPLDRRQVSARTIKVVHEHYGHSKVPDPAASEGVVYQLRLQRKNTCDESFESFIKSSPRLVASGAAVESPPSGNSAVLFLNGADLTNIPGRERLPCYLLREVAVVTSPRK